ncbi:uncharacterized protein C8Q71DRAFT_340231 [Rhodofomes roseus]|uniref:F-box domain-containing protein n=1 Tax=Rhodofomes roseus TaxID=34475 RepID=A0ABQ8KS25_9APHY|nr:uncharacterized protein C8Q71DRAFT_340231 [Rhodofomes roseus]KAH9841608.1 hypothetical protein C8Q71DRAFT_340231 [Rhodofomes roseus]
MPLANIPAELIYHILEQGYYTPVGSVDQQTLRACALVSRNWAKPAQQLLFHSVGVKQCIEFTVLFSRGGLPPGSAARLGGYVRSLDFVFDIHKYIYVTGASIRCPSTFVALLSFFPRLYQLSLFVSGKGAIPSKCIRQLEILVATPHRQPLRALSLMGASDAPMVLFQLLSVFSGVQFLRLERYSSPRCPPGVAPVKLCELNLRFLPELKVLRWILSSSRSTLQILDLHIPMLNDDYLALLIEHAPQVRSLRLHIGCPDMNLDSLIRACVKLEELVLHQSLDWPSEIPASLQHLCIDKIADETLTVLESLPRLRFLTITTQHASLHHDFHRLVRKCDARRIELSFKRFEAEDPVHVKHFPRGRSVENFSLMR